MNPYQQFVSEYARLTREGKTFPLGGFPKCARPSIASDAPKVLIFSPHPDDEVVIGGLALRLLREAQWNVINVAVTLGSRKERQPGRLAELRGCCDCIGFGLVETTPDGLDPITTRVREQDPAHWSRSVKMIAAMLKEHRPRIILIPHDQDWHPTHIGTHFLVLDALKSAGDVSCYVVETEFWGQMQSPNLMVELSAQDLGDLITALTFHVVEVKRNPYHLLLPAWMMDNVRRGAELVGGQGGAAPDYQFAILYRIRRWNNGRLESMLEKGRLLSVKEKADVLFA